MKIQNSKFKIQNFGAFTLIELLVVIAIIAILAAFLIPVAGAVKRQTYLNTARGEMAQIETAIESYKAARGFYPPDNPGNPLTNQLYYELTGTTATPGNPPSYQTYDGIQTLTSVNLNDAFGPNVSGFLNTTKPGAGEDSLPAKNFIGDVKPKEKGSITGANNVSITNLVTSVGGPDGSYRPLGIQGVNPWRYVSSNPANNHGRFDLWVQLKIGNKTNLVCNWSGKAQINTQWP